MNYNVTDIEFDFDDDYANGFDLTFDEEIELRDLALGVWQADNEDDLIEEITSSKGKTTKGRVVTMKNLRINMNLDQYEALTDLICFAYDNGYYHNRLDTDIFDDMADSVIGAKGYDS